MKKKTKGHFILAIITVLFSAPVYSQGPYINLLAGYGMSAAPMFMGSEFTSTSDGTGTVNDAKIIKGSGSLGRGIQMGGAFGYNFTDNIGVELGFGYLMGSKNTVKNSYISTTSSTEIETNTSGSMFRIIPSLRISSGNGKIKPYMRMGVVAGLGAKVNESYKYYSQSNGNTATKETETEFSGGAAFGFAGSIGTDFKASDKFGFFAEIGIITQSWAPQKSVITKYTGNGIDLLPNMTISQKEIEYVDQFSETVSNIGTSSPTIALKEYMPFSSVSFNLGLSYFLR